VVIVDEIPASATGKLRRLGLAERLDLTDGGRSRSQAAAPRNALEARLVEIWCDVLKRNRVGIHEGFLSLGGDSIQASRLLSKIGDALGIEVPFVALFEAQTIARLAEVIMGILGEDSGTTPSSAQDA
jgi:acyl carrier protein